MGKVIECTKRFVIIEKLLEGGKISPESEFLNLIRKCVIGRVGRDKKHPDETDIRFYDFNNKILIMKYHYDNYYGLYCDWEYYWEKFRKLNMNGRMNGREIQDFTKKMLWKYFGIYVNAKTIDCHFHNYGELIKSIKLRDGEELGAQNIIKQYGQIEMVNTQ